MTDRRRRIARLEQRLIDAKHSWLHGYGRGLASLLAWDKAHPEPDLDSLADYVSDGSDLVGLTQLLFYPSLRAELG